MRNSKPIRCGKCGGNTGPFTTFVNASSGGSHLLCAVCMSTRTAEQVDDLAEIDELIAEYETMTKNLEEVVREEEDTDLPPELEAIAFTPMKTYKLAQMTLAALRSKRLALVSHGENEERLQYELKKTVEEENYEAAGAIQKRLEEMRAEPPEKRKNKKQNAEKSLSQLFSSGEPDAGLCILCKENFPKAPGLFANFEIGSCHEMCLSCCVNEVPSHVKTIKMADEMIAELEKFSGLMDKMAIFGKMMSGDIEIKAHDEEDAKNLFKNLTEKEKGKTNTEGQQASQMLLKVLKQRRKLLELTNEDVEMMDAVDLFGDLLFDMFQKNTVADIEGLLFNLTGKNKSPQNRPVSQKAPPKKGNKKRK